MVIKIGTHNGKFHADDVFSVAAFKLFHPFDDIVVIRERDLNLLSQCDFIVDVGGIYDGERIFDHHQNNVALIQRNGIKHSAFGLVMEFIIKNSKLLDILKSNIIYGIEAADNRQQTKYSNKGAWVSSFNIDWDDSLRTQDDAFMEAVDVAVRILRKDVERAKSSLAARNVINVARDNSDGPILILNKYMPWEHEVVNYMPDVKIVILPTSDGKLWIARAVPIDCKQSYVCRFKYPAKWCGLSGEHFKRISEIDGGVSCHVGGFVSTWETRDAAIAGAAKALTLGGK